MSARAQLRSADAAVEVDPGDGGRLTSLTVGGVELLGGIGGADFEHGSFVMAPWAGRIRDGLLTVAGVEHQLPVDRLPPHAGLGLVLDRPWEVLDSHDAHLTMRIELDDRWPWAGFVVQGLTLEPDGLTLSAEVHSTGEPFPATLGWHPWFRRQLDLGGPAELDLAVDGMLLRDSAGIPSGEVVAVPAGPWDDCFVGVRWPVRITWPGALTLSIASDHDHMVVYNERAEAFCVEPQSGPPDGPNTAPAMVAPSVPLTATTRWAWS
jgi:aldose 1-epimerase